jgi:hypothetical protein
MIAARLLALLQQIRRHGSVSLGRLVRLGADEQEIRALVDTGLVAPLGHGLALTEEGTAYSFEEEPTLGSFLDAYEQAEAVSRLQTLLETPEPCSQVSDEDQLPTPHPALSRDWSTQ